MAIQFARVEYVSRSAGKNACCKSAYNGRARINDEKTNVTYTFERKEDNIYHKILLPEYVDKKFANISELANEVERTEKRINSSLYKEYLLALPDNKEIRLENKIELVNKFIEKKEFIKNGLGVQIDIHSPHDGDKNWHAHLLVTTRRFKEDGSGLGEKARDLDPEVRGGTKHFVTGGKDLVGELWKDLQNEYFKEKGFSLRVDEVSKEPGKHLGPVRMRGLMNEASEFHKERRNANLRMEMLKDSDDLLDLVTINKSIFDSDDLQKIVSNIASDEAKENLISKALENERILELKDRSGKSTDLYTTKEVRSQEERVMRIANRIREQMPIGRVTHSKFDYVSKMVDDYDISFEQGSSLSYIMPKEGGAGLRILQGKAGTGKSHVLSKIKKIKQSSQNIIALAPTHKAVNELKGGGYNEADTIKGFLFKYKNDRINVKDNSLFIVDEAAMVGTETYLELFKIIERTKSELILAGDDGQLSSIERGGLFTILSEIHGKVVLEEVRRQKEGWGKDLSYLLSRKEIGDSMELLRLKEKLKFDNSKEESMAHLLNDWSKSEFDIKDRLIIAIENKDVDALNQGARDILKAEGKIRGKEFEIENDQTKANFAVGDRIVMTKTDKKAGIINGEFGEIKKISEDSITIKFDNEKDKVKQSKPSKSVIFELETIQFKHGYAATVFKSQGSSIKDVYGLHNKFNTINNSYVQMTRQIDDLHYYVNRNATKNEKILVEQLSRDLDRGTSLNYKIESDFEDRDKNLLIKAKSWVKDKLVNIGDKFHQNKKYYEFTGNENKLSKSNIREVKNSYEADHVSNNLNNVNIKSLDLIMEKEYNYVNVREVVCEINQLESRRVGLIEQENYLYLKDNYKEAIARGDKEFGIEDSRGATHIYPSIYLKSIVNDKELMNKLINNDIFDKNSEFGKEIGRIENSTNNQDKDQDKYNLMNSKERDEMKLYVTSETERNYEYLKANWKESMGDKEFGVKDFQGEKHRYPSTYFDSVRKDENIRDFIDKDSKIGKEIQKENIVQMNRSRGMEIG